MIKLQESQNNLIVLLLHAYILNLIFLISRFLISYNNENEYAIE